MGHQQKRSEPSNRNNNSEESTFLNEEEEVQNRFNRNIHLIEEEAGRTLDLCEVFFLNEWAKYTA